MRAIVAGSDRRKSVMLAASKSYVPVHGLNADPAQEKRVDRGGRSSLIDCIFQLHANVTRGQAAVWTHFSRAGVQNTYVRHKFNETRIVWAGNIEHTGKIRECL